MSLFVRTVEEGSFSAAARALDLTPSAVSKQINRLEDRLNVRLFNRTTRQLSLTEAGRAFYGRCTRIVADIDAAEEAVHSLHNTVRGVLRVSATVAFARVQVVPRLATFLARYPELSIHFELTDRSVDLVEEGIDVAIRLSEQVDDPSLVARKLAVNRRMICAAPAYLARRGMPASPEALREHNCLTLYNVTSFNEWEFEAADSSRKIRVAGSFSANNADALYQAVLAGIGLARLSLFLVEPDIKAGRLVPVLPEYIHEKAALFALYPHRRHLSSKARAFVDFLIEQFTPVPPWEV